MNRLACLRVSRPLTVALALAFLPVPPAHAGTNEWTLLGLEGGRVWHVEFSRASPETMFALAESGLYRSALDGTSWERSSTASTEPATGASPGRRPALRRRSCSYL